MKVFLKVFIISILIVSCKNDNSKTEDENHLHQEVPIEQTTPKAKKTLSPHTSAMAMIGDAHVHIDYSSPGVRNRIVFGGLLPYNEVWQAGAHMATWIETNKDLNFDGKILPAGKYGLFAIPSENEWTIIFNSHWNQHGKDEYDIKNDKLRIKIKPSISEDITEHLLYQVKKISDSQGNISMSWEKITINFNFEVVN